MKHCNETNAGALVALCNLLLVAGCGSNADEIGLNEGANGACKTVDIRTMANLSTRADANPEIVDLVHGAEGVALVVSSTANQVSELLYTSESLEFGREVVLDTGSDTSNMSSIKVDPTGSFVAVTVTEDDCVEGRTMFVEIGKNFGTITNEVAVGFGPDSGAFSQDGNYFVVANEDDREDHPCKPAGRDGGSVTVIDLSAGTRTAQVAQTLLIDHAKDSEPEGVVVTDEGKVIITLQETSELAFFSLADIPSAEVTIVSLPEGSEPDGVAITPDGRWAVVALEGGDALAVVNLADDSVESVYTIRDSGDVPSHYNRDEEASNKIHEPESIVTFEQGSVTFVAVALQESHAVAVYSMDESGELSFDSIAPTGAYESEDGGRTKSDIGPEGLAYDPEQGVFIAANEREGSLTLLTSSAAHGCSE